MNERSKFSEKATTMPKFDVGDDGVRSVDPSCPSMPYPISLPGLLTEIDLKNRPKAL